MRTTSRINNSLRQPRRRRRLPTRNFCAGFLCVICTLYLFSATIYINYVASKSCVLDENDTIPMRLHPVERLRTPDSENHIAVHENKILYEDKPLDVDSTLPSGTKVIIAYGALFFRARIWEKIDMSLFIAFLTSHFFSQYPPAVSLTGCNAGFTADGAAVLKHSIELSSYPVNKNSKYSYKMILFAHKDALECSKPFEKLGYEVQIKDTPIDASKIKGDFLREHVVKTGPYSTRTTCMY